jgi:copper chaperone CopZ
MTTLKETGALELSTRVELAFDSFPCGPCASEAEAALYSLSGLMHVEFNGCVHRATIYFDPSKADIATLIAALSPFAPNARVLSVVIPRLQLLAARTWPKTSVGSS